MKSRRHIAIKISRAHIRWVKDYQSMELLFGVVDAKDSSKRQSNHNWGKGIRQHEKRQKKIMRKIYGSQSTHIHATKSNRFGRHKFNPEVTV